MPFSQLPFGSGSFRAPKKVGALIGLDISDSAIKLVELSQSGSSVKLERYAIGEMPKGLISDGNFNAEKLDLIAESIRTTWSKMGTKTRHVALALPVSMAMYRKIQLPLGSEEEIESMVEGEAVQLVPFPLDEVNLDYQILGSSEDSNGLDVMVCAARKEKVEERVAVVEMAGLEASIVEIDVFSAASALEMIQQQVSGKGRNQTAAVFDIGANKLHCYVIRNGQPMYFREQSIGGQQLTRDIQRVYGITLEEAEKGKRSMNLPDGYAQELLQPFVGVLTQEVQRVMQYFYTTVSASLYQKVDYIVLAGGCGALLGLDDAISASTKINTIVANPFGGIGHSSKVNTKELLLDAPSLLNACGLAMRGCEI